MNDLKEVERHARALMTAHGVGSLTFAFDRGKRRVGATYFVTIGTTTLAKKISLSKYFAELLTMEEIRDTMLHEIAHAKAGRDAGHGPEWKREARKLGISGDRCKVTSASPEKSVKGWCGDCQVEVLAQHRLPLRVYKHTRCGGLLTWFKNGTGLTPCQMPARYQNELRRYLTSQGR